MAHKRKNFTDSQKAQIFVRDRATCCFSGANLWLLDSPLRPGNETDWVDHVLPSARGGGNDIENGVCASHTYNSKKRHNAADTFYLFKCGLPTAGYYDVFGSVSREQEERLERLSHLKVEDWFLNRAITWAMEALRDRCDREFCKIDYKRDSEYWFSAGYRKLLNFQRVADSRSLEDRGIIDPDNQIVKQWLLLREVDSRNDFVSVAEELFPVFRENYIAWTEYFWNSDGEEETTKAYQRAMTSDRICSNVRESIECDYRLRYGS